MKKVRNLVIGCMALMATCMIWNNEAKAAEAEKYELSDKTALTNEEVYYYSLDPVFISASNEPSGCACTSIRRLPRGSNTP